MFLNSLEAVMRRFFFLIFSFVTCLEAQTVTVIGVGKLGLCLALSMERAGFEVLGVDSGDSYIQQLNAWSLQSPEPMVSEYLSTAKNFRATTSLDEGLAFSDLYFVVLPTNPPSKLGDYDCELLTALLAQINERQVKNKHLVIVSTLFPGYIRNVAIPQLSDCPGITVSYNPEFIAQGEILKGLEQPDLVLIGSSNQEKGDEIKAVYQKICTNQPYWARMSPESAEVMKLSLNCFVTMKIAFANLVGDIADATEGANKNDILQALGNDQRIGGKCLKAGYGFGGPCFPRDNRALGLYAQNIGIEPTLFLATEKANQAHASAMAEKFLQLGLGVYEFDDVGYKAKCPVPIIEESQKLLVAKKIAEAGKVVIIKDSPPIIEKVKAEYGDLFQYGENL